MKALLFLPMMISLAAAAPVSNSNVVPLWPEGVPNAKADLGAEKNVGGSVSKVSEPSITMYSPAVDRPNGTAVIICPGGGYGNLSVEREGVQYANWLSTLGVRSFVLKYRLAEFGHPAPLQDVLRAVRLVRSRAAEWKINPERIGVMGSSAGGHLAASAGTLFDHADGKTGAALDGEKARPDFLILMYPVISMKDPTAHGGSRKNLLGEKPTAEQLKLMSLEEQVTGNTPPTLLIHTQEDTAVPVENSIVFYQALTRANVPAEMYLFEKGAHGMGRRAGLGTSSEWHKRAEEWLDARGLLEVKKP